MTAWLHLSDEELLKVRICDLKVGIEGSPVEPRVEQLHDELDRAGLSIRPHCYLSDEWLSPDGEAAIGIPFYLAHPRLRSLEFRMMFEVEGGTRSWCMKLLRHEAAHAIDHAFRLNRRRDWQGVFGSPREPYNPYYYGADPTSKGHVRNLPDNYAQCHPEEDFAETFAVWLRPNSNWRIRYRGWPAMRKLRYVHRAMGEIAGRRGPRRKPALCAAAGSLRSTLGSYYRRKHRLYGSTDLSFAVSDMKRIFRASRAVTLVGPAADFIRRHKRQLVDSVAAWSEERATAVGQLCAGLARLCDEHRLVVRDDLDSTLVHLSSYVTTLVVNRQHTLSYRTRRR